MSLFSGKIVVGGIELSVQMTPTVAGVNILYYPEYDDLDYRADLLKLYEFDAKDDQKSGTFVRRQDISFNGRYKTTFLNKDVCSLIADAFTAMDRYTEYSGVVNNGGSYVYAFEKTVGEGVVKSRVTSSSNLPRICWADAQCIRFRDTVRGLEIDLYRDDSFDDSLYKLFGPFENKNKYGKTVYLGAIKYFAFKSEYNKLFIREVEAYGGAGLVYPDFETLKKHSTKDFSWLDEKDYYIVTKENLDDVLALFEAHDGYIGFDTETFGTDVNAETRRKGQGYIVGFSLSKKYGEGYYFPLQHQMFENLTDDVQFFLTSKVKRLLETKKLIAANTAFDYRVMYGYGIHPNIVYDVQVVVHITFGYMKNVSVPVALKGMTKYFLGFDMVDLDDTVVGGTFDERVNFSLLPYDVVKAYAPTDADVLLALMELFEERGYINEYASYEVFSDEVEFAKACAYSEYHGYYTNPEKRDEFETKVNFDMEKAANELYKIVGYEFNINSSKQLSKAMYEDAGVPRVKGSDSTNKQILETLLDEKGPDGECVYPFVKYLKAYRDTSANVRGFLKQYDDVVHADGIIYPNIYAFGADTGRVSYKEPNVQSYNKTVKTYIEGRKGFICWNSDLSQIEIRVMASLAGVQSLINALSDSDTDAHTFTASQMYSVHYTLVDKMMRSGAKALSFGIPYGMSDKRAGSRVYGENDPDHKRKGKQLIDLYFKTFGEIKVFLDNVRAEALQRGYSETYIGRRRWYDKLKSDKGSIERMSGNHVIQGSAADYYKKSVVRLYHAIRERGWEGLVLFSAFVHDEIEGELHESIDFIEFAKVWREAFEHQPEGWCKIFAEFGIGKNWYEAKSMGLPPDYLDRLVSLENGSFGSGDIVFENLKDDLHHFLSKKTINALMAEENQGKPMSNPVALGIINTLGISGYKFKDDFEGCMQKFCEDGGIDRNSFNVLPPDYTSVASFGSGGTDDVSVGGEPEFDMLSGVTDEDMAYSMVNTWGSYLSDDGVFFLKDDGLFKWAYSEGLLNAVGGIPVRIYRGDSELSEPTKISISMASVKAIKDKGMEISRLRSRFDVKRFNV